MKTKHETKLNSKLLLTLLEPTIRDIKNITSTTTKGKNTETASVNGFSSLE